LPSLLIRRSFPLPPAWKERPRKTSPAGEVCFRFERPVLPHFGFGLPTVPTSGRLGAGHWADSLVRALDSLFGCYKGIRDPNVAVNLLPVAVAACLYVFTDCSPTLIFRPAPVGQRASRGVGKPYLSLHQTPATDESI
jgi:hypothetical protein